MTVPAIQIERLIKDFGSFRAVADISLSISQGRFFGFLGPNGAGKTTTINVLTGLCTPTSGAISIFGQDAFRQYQSCRKRIGLAPQDFNFDRFFPIRRIIEFEAGYFGIPAKVARPRIDRLFQRFGLTEKAGQTVQTLSGGLKRRLQLVKALIHDPDILILDEPTAGVDLELRHELWAYLRELNQQGKTIFLTTHYLEEAENLCDEIAIIHKGRIVEQGMTKALLDKHKQSLEDLFLSHVLEEKGDRHRKLDPILDAL